jgi:hypothetical protein
MRKIRFYLLMGAILLTTSCSTDFDIDADWKDIALVYGILNQNDTAHYIKLNKVFLGDLDAYYMAAQADSIYYPEARVFLEPLSNGSNIFDYSGNIVRYELSETYEIPKEPGIFFDDYNLLYKTKQTLNPDYGYKLNIEIPGKEPITSETSLVKNINVKNPNTNPATKITFSNLYEYMNYEVEIETSADGAMYGLVVRFYYRENTPEGTVDKYLDWNQPSKKKGSASKLVWDLNGESFYSYLNFNIPQGNIETTRKALKLDFIFMVAGEELVAFIEVNGPSDGIVQERPAFTNIENGIGVFSARYDKTIPNKQLTDLSLDRLACSPYTKHLRFEDSNFEVDACD